MKNLYREIIPQIYEGVCNPDALNQLMDKIQEYSCLAGANIFSGDEIEQELNRFHICSDMITISEEYFSKGYHEIDVTIYKNILQNQNEGEFLLEKDILSVPGAHHPGADALNTVHNWCHKSYGMVSRGACLLNAKPNHWDFLGLHFKDLGQHSKLTFKNISLIVPHLAKVLTLNRPYTLLKHRYNAVLDVLDKFKLGVAILNLKSEVIIKNLAATRIIENDKIFTIKKTGILKFNSPDNIDLPTQLEILEKSIENPKSLSVSLPQKGRNARYLVEISCIRSNDVGSSNYFLVLIVDAKNTSIIDISGISELYNLTASEQSVSQHILDGLSNAEIAESRNVSQETVKSQVKSIYTKLGCEGRVQLVSLAHRVNLPID